jgi:ubiquinone/menaquinone biosynthesis C-methylase UbiE
MPGPAGGRPALGYSAGVARARPGGRGPSPGGPSSGASYSLPRHPTEIDRLDVQHYVVRETVGANYLAPLRQPGLVLDVGCGPGQWAYDLCDEFPEAIVAGLDLVPSKPRRPPNFRLVRGNVLDGLPFVDDRFDFVHQRFLISGVPVRSFATEVRDLARVTRPGGWVQLVESDSQSWLAPIGPANLRLQEMGSQLVRPLGLDTTGVVHGSLERYLEQAGIEGVQRRSFAAAVGAWGGRIGELVATDFRAVYLRLGEVFESRLGLSRDESHALQASAQAEWEELQTRWSFTLVWGRKAVR